MYDYELYGSRISTLGTLGIIAILLAIIATVLPSFSSFQPNGGRKWANSANSFTTHVILSS